MVLDCIRRLAKEEDGQALVLAALFMLVAAVAVLSISNLGRSIHDRIQLQNAADATAYTLATNEARAFNFYAYTNRAQIAQYVTILQVLSLDSMLLGVLVGLGAFAALMKNAAEVCDDGKAALCAAVPKIGWALLAISRTATVVEAVARQAARAIKAFDAFVGSVLVPLLVGANLFLFASQAAFLAMVLGRLGGDGIRSIARRTAPRAELRLGAAAHSLSNGLRFVQAHLAESTRLFGTSDPPGARIGDGEQGKKNLARRGMGELIHASRHGAFVYDRTFPGPLAELPDTTPGLAQAGSLMALLSLRFQGHTRLHSEGSPSPSPSSMAGYYAQMEQAGYATARYPTGNSIGANFYPALGGGLTEVSTLFGLGRKELGSVTSAGGSVKGWACAWDPEDPYHSVSLGVITLYAPKFGCDMNRGKHPWWGITPYMAFDATGPGCERFDEDHCQPDTWVVLGNPGGATAVSRGLAYYHRPGSWREPPNFFNPHWKARLAPAAAGLSRASGEVGALLGSFPGEWAERALTH